MKTVVTVIEWWAALSFIGTPIFLALLRSGFIRFVPVRK